MDIENKEGHSPSLPKAENDPVKEQGSYISFSIRNRAKKGR